MKIFFNHPIKGAFQMIKELEKQIILIKDIEDNPLEDSWSFFFSDVKFFIVYDRYSEKNEMIPNFSIISYADDEGNLDKSTLKVTQNLYKYLKQVKEIYNLFYEED
jgi:hypothetical protein